MQGRPNFRCARVWPAIGACLHGTKRRFWLVSFVTWLTNFVHLTGGVGGFWRDQENDSAIKIRIVALRKLMTMSSYLINSNYIEPSFPPCEEYQQNGYIPVSSDYYERPKDSGFPHHEEATYPRSDYQDPSYDYGNVSSNGLVEFNDRHHIQPQSVPPNRGPHLSTDICTGTTVTKDCSLATEAPTTPPKGKEPVVYPWMKKVHVNTGKNLSWSIKDRQHTGKRPSESFKRTYSVAFSFLIRAIYDLGDVFFGH